MSALQDLAREGTLSRKTELDGRRKRFQEIVMLTGEYHVLGMCVCVAPRDISHCAIARVTDYKHRVIHATSVLSPALMR